MSVTLSDFFAQMQPYLLGQQDLAQTRETLGPSPSGDHDFSFYRVLAERNLFKVMRELYGPLRTLMLRDHAEATARGTTPGNDTGPAERATWPELVAEYLAAHPPGGRHPNALGEALPEFLAARRERRPSQPVIYEEIADFCWIRMQVYRAPDDEGDGFDSRLLVRQYSYPIPDFVGALERDPQAPTPEARPMVVLVYRHWRLLQTRIFLPSAAGLVALARRQGAGVPAALQAVPTEHVDVAEQQLVAHGVLAPEPARSAGSELVP